MVSSTAGNNASRARKMTLPARARSARPSLDRNDAAEVVPLEEDVDVLESDMSEQPLVLLETVRDENVFQRLALLRDLHVAVTLATLQLVVMVDEEPVESRMLAEDLLDEQKAAVVIESAKHAADDRLTVQWTNELQRQHHQRHRRILDRQPIVQIVQRELVRPRKPRDRQLLSRGAQHVVGGIQTHEANIQFRRQRRADRQQRIG